MRANVAPLTGTVSQIYLIVVRKLIALLSGHVRFHEIFLDFRGRGALPMIIVFLLEIRLATLPTLR
jgi:hypothetical protein